ncbi:MAG TPA: hemin uptake protein HemP [Hyphomicrobiales bacterium]|nr:hemin uptake protein HemP [Hyphomicrobiales bacterium]
MIQDDVRKLADARPPAWRNPEAPPRTLTTTELFGTGQELIILHDGTRYRLRITRAGKLILTK